MIPTPSDEQQKVITLYEDNSVSVNSLAGSGKTTTILNVVKSNPLSRFAIITYNARLKLSLREAFYRENVENAESHTYHSFALKYYSPKIHTDQGIMAVVENNMIPAIDINFDGIMVDEIQDMTPLYYEFIIKLLHDNLNREFSMIVIGDVDQCIYRFNGASPYYLTLASSIFPGKWKSGTLSISYRISTKMAAFINKVLLKSINGVKELEESVDYVYTEGYSNKKNYNILQLFESYLETYEYTDIMVLAPSVKVKNYKSMNPVMHFANLLSEKGIPIFVPNSDDEQVDSSVLKGKLPFLSFHQSKGMEAKCVVIFGFDMSYYLYYNKNGDKTKCTNEVYVASTRAKEKLCLVHNIGFEHLPYIPVEEIDRTCKIYGKYKDIQRERKSKKGDIHVIALTQNIPQILVKELLKLVEIRTEKHESKVLDINVKVKQENLVEDVSNINAIVFPMILQYKIEKKSTILTRLLERKLINEIPNYESLTIPDCLQHANSYNGFISGYDFKLNQIKDYNWCGTEKIEENAKMVDILDRILLHTPEPKSFMHEVSFAINGYLIYGEIDYFSGCSIVEFKCVKDVTSTHVLQTIVYYYLFMEFINKYKAQIANGLKNKDIETVVSRNYKPIIYNILSNTTYYLDITFENAKHITEQLLFNYNGEKKVESIEAFIEKCKKISDKYQ